MTNEEREQMTADLKAFIAEVLNDQVLESWFLGQFSDAELTDRLKYLRQLRAEDELKKRYEEDCDNLAVDEYDDLRSF